MDAGHFDELVTIESYTESVSSNTGQRVRNTTYQRKVMRYWGSIEEIPETVEYKEKILRISALAWD